MNKNWRRVLSQRERPTNFNGKKPPPCMKKEMKKEKTHITCEEEKEKKKVDTTTTNGWEKDSIRRAEEEEEEGERKARRGNGAVEARTDGVMDRVGVASQGCVCIACLVEIKYDRSVFLFRGE